ncbi:MAG: saccharopine dehydrogenase NADP-binding domain-containing protein [Gordonia amarae]
MTTAPRIFVLGATGYTGELTARSLVRQGAHPVLLGRSPARLETLAADLGGLDTAIVDVSEPSTLRAVLHKGDVLISTVGPFLKYGRTAIETAAETGVHYFDSTGEGPFIREIFEHWGPVAERHGAGLIPAFGYDYGPGAYAAALALYDAGEQATAVDIGYFAPGFKPSGGTRATAVGVLLEDGYTFRDGHIQPERSGRRTKRFNVEGRSLLAASVPAAEQFGLPQAYPGLREVNVMLGFPQSAARSLAIGSHLLGPFMNIGMLKRGITAAADRMVKGSSGGPDASARAQVTTAVVAVARSTERELATVTLTGPDPYEVTGDLLAWGAIAAAGGGLQSQGALGPVKAFGLHALGQACATAGLVRSDNGD